MSAGVPSADVMSGLLVYATPGGRHTGRLRESPEDFRVEEVLDLRSLESDRKHGYVPVYRVSKRSIDTPHVMELLAESIRSKVNVAGLKDSRAVTVQYVSARSSRAESPEKVTGERFDAELVGFAPRPLSRGMLAGNRFTITVRSREDMEADVRAVYALCERREMPNFFGYQRFGLRGMVNHRVGRAIVKREFAEATRLILSEPRAGEEGEAAEARRLAGEERYEESLRLLSRRQDLERRVASHLAQRRGDHLGAMRRIQLPVRRIFVQAYQSYLFNLTLSESLRSGLALYRAERGDNWATLSLDGLGATRVHGVKEPLDGDAIPMVQLVGYAFRDYRSRFDSIIREVSEREGVSPSQFYVKEAEELSSEGGFRQAPLLAREMAYERADGTHILSFVLGRGEFATTLVREVLKPEDPLRAGF